jgi:GNAT superfamily N-acetyltransferase
MLAPGSGIVGRLAEENGSVVGFTVSVLHAGTWTKTPICYLEDLFVDPEIRGKGIGKALIEDLIAMARERGWSRLYWNTRASNATARRLYDRFVQADDFVRYLLVLE